MKLTINGESKQIEQDQNPLSLESVVKQLGHNPKLVVVEFNGTILPPRKWRDQPVNEGDALEIVTIVGGGS